MVVCMVVAYEQGSVPMGDDELSDVHGRCAVRYWRQWSTKSRTEGLLLWWVVGFKRVYNGLMHLRLPR
jgi:hypothetical protein